MLDAWEKLEIWPKICVLACFTEDTVVPFSVWQRYKVKMQITDICMVFIYIVWFGIHGITFMKPNMIFWTSSSPSFYV